MGPRFKSRIFFNVVNFHFRLTELGISGMGMKISLKSVKIWLRYEGLKFEKKVRDSNRGPLGNLTIHGVGSVNLKPSFLSQILTDFNKIFMPMPEIPSS